MRGWVTDEKKPAINRLVPCQGGCAQNIFHKMGKLACAAVRDRHMLRQTAPRWNSACLMDIQPRVVCDGNGCSGAADPRQLEVGSASKHSRFFLAGWKLLTAPL